MSKHRSRDEQPSRVVASDWLPLRSANCSLSGGRAHCGHGREMVRYV
jgi:hypothetical protein